MNPTSLDEAVAYLREHLPGWWWRGGVCHVSAEVLDALDRAQAEDLPPNDPWNR
jgi:hypothetical protein